MDSGDDMTCGLQHTVKLGAKKLRSASPLEDVIRAKGSRQPEMLSYHIGSCLCVAFFQLARQGALFGELRDALMQQAMGVLVQKGQCAVGRGEAGSGNKAPSLAKPLSATCVGRLFDQKAVRG